jgi:hypothetical protein
MNVGGSPRRLNWIAILVIALLMASLQAKLGLYRTADSQAHLISKVFKPSECRLDRAVLDPPLVTASLAIAAEPAMIFTPQDLLEYAPTQRRQRFLSRSPWFRPPPVRS